MQIRYKKTLHATFNSKNTHFKIITRLQILQNLTFFIYCDRIEPDRISIMVPKIKLYKFVQKYRI